MEKLTLKQAAKIAGVSYGILHRATEKREGGIKSTNLYGTYKFVTRKEALRFGREYRRRQRELARKHAQRNGIND